MTRDHNALYLRRSFADFANLRIPHEALDGIVLSVAIPPVELNGCNRGAHGELGAEQLRHRGLFSERMPVLGQPRCMKGQMSAGLDFGRQVRELELHALKARDGMAELAANSRVLQRLLEGPL